jgi:hypothetical protein
MMRDSLNEIVIVKQNSSICSIPFELILKIASFLEEITDINNFSHTCKHILTIMKQISMEFDKPILDKGNHGNYSDYLLLRHNFYNKENEIKKIEPSSFSRYFVKQELLVDSAIAGSIALSLALGLSLSGYSIATSATSSIVTGVVSIISSQTIRFFCNKKINESDDQITNLNTELNEQPKPVLNKPM